MIPPHRRRGSVRAAAWCLVLAGCSSAPLPGPGVAADEPAVDFTVELPPVTAAPPADEAPPADGDVAATAPATAAPATPEERRAAVAERMAEMAAVAAANAPVSAAPPVWLTIPSIGVSTGTIHLDLKATTAEVPESFDIAGWYRQTMEPGTRGPAVIVGHVGSRDGPGVFARLDELQPGDEIVVTDEAGTQRTFVVDRTALVPKDERPADVFEGTRERPELRLITCGGEFDVTNRRHLSNHVVWAHEAGT